MALMWITKYCGEEEDDAGGGVALVLVLLTVLGLRVVLDVTVHARIFDEPVGPTRIAVPVAIRQRAHVALACAVPLSRIEGRGRAGRCVAQRRQCGARQRTGACGEPCHEERHDRCAAHPLRVYEHPGPTCVHTSPSFTPRRGFARSTRQSLASSSRT